MEAISERIFLLSNGKNASSNLGRFSYDVQSGELTHVTPVSLPATNGEHECDVIRKKASEPGKRNKASL